MYNYILCDWGVKNQREFGNKCEKRKGKEGGRHLLASVMNTRYLCKGKRGHCVGQCKGHPPWPIRIYRICMVYEIDHV